MAVYLYSNVAIEWKQLRCRVRSISVVYFNESFPIRSSYCDQIFYLITIIT